MLTRLRFRPPSLSGDWQKDGPAVLDAISDYLLSLEQKGALTVTEAQVDSTKVGSNSASTGAFTSVSATAGVVSAASFDANVAGSVGALKTTGSYGGAWSLLDGVVFSGIYTQSTGDQLVFFTGQGAADKPNAKIRAILSSTGLGLGVTPSYKFATSTGTVWAAQVVANNAAESYKIGIKAPTDGASADRCEIVFSATVGGGGSDSNIGFWTNTYGVAFAERLRIEKDGRIYGTALHNNAGAVTGTTNQYIASGTYTPTLTNVSNVAASTMRSIQWIRVGNVVHVGGEMDIDATAAAPTTTVFDITLPIASNLASTFNLGGVGCRFGSGGMEPVQIIGEAAGDKARFSFLAGDAANLSLSFTFTYVVL